MRFSNILACRAGSWRPIGNLANIGRESLLNDRGAPEGRDFVSPPFEDERLGDRDLRCSRVVDPDLLLIKHKKLSCVAYLAGAHERVEGGVRHHVVCSRRLAEFMPHASIFGGLDLLFRCRAEDLGGCVTRELGAAAEFADVGCCVF